MPRPPNAPPEPWHPFLTDLDRAASQQAFLQCLGGFVITQLYGLQRPTGDVDVLSTLPPPDKKLIETGRRGSELHKKYGIYLDVVTVASLPYAYEQRLKEMFPAVYQHLRLFALDPYDLALAKLCRNIERDRDDVKYLARTIPFDLEVLRNRYKNELRPYVVGNPSDHDLTMELWIEMIQEERHTTPQ